MDRLSALILGLAVAAAARGCSDRKPADGTGAGGDPPSRVNAAKTAGQRGATVEAFCDAHFARGKGPALTWPALAPGEAAPAAAKTWRWVNVWATWCKPCLDEMPRLRAWRDQAATAGKPFDLVFVSMDASADDIAELRRRHPDTPPSLRLANPELLGPWMNQVGLAGSPPIPIHVFVDPDNRVRCARSAGVRDQDRAMVDKVLASE